MLLSLVDSEEFKKWIANMKYLIEKELRDQQDIKSSTGNNSIVVEHSRNH